MNDMSKKKRVFVTTIGIVCLALTFAICVQVKTIQGATQILGQTQEEAKLRDEVFRWKERYDNIYKDLENSEKVLESYREKASQSNGESASIEAELKLANNLLGLTELTGKGIIVTLDDNKTANLDTLNVSSYLVHAEDIVELINELKDAGAEAIGVNGQRIISTTGIVCDGNVIKINDTKIGAPYIIRAIGYPEWLESALIMPAGYIQRLNDWGVVTKVEKSNSITLPKYNGVYSSDNIENVK